MRRGIITLITALIVHLGSANATTHGKQGNKMTKSEFWALIARSDNADCELQVENLRGLLTKLPVARIRSFERQRMELMAESYRRDLWAVAYIVNGGCSDDGFEYFRAWLISRGKAYYEAALRDAVRAADNIKPGDEIECESLMYVCGEAYLSVAGKELPPSNVSYPTAPVGETWEEGDLSQLYPTLSERFR